MKTLYAQVKERLSIADNMYDSIRVVDPINKNFIIFKDEKIKKIKNTCYDLWNRGLACPNCISIRAYNEKDTIVKIEYVNKKVILVIATPVFIDERMYVIEMLKDISENGRIVNIDTNSDVSVCAVINEMNEKIIENEKKETVKEVYGASREIRNWEINDIKLEILNKQIESLRDVLNEMCLIPYGKTQEKQKLAISQYLDELIVEYMKNI